MVALRADLDALPVSDQTEDPWRSGTDDVLPLDRAWAAALAEACRSAEVTLRGVYLSTPGGVRRLG